MTEYKAVIAVLTRLESLQNAFDQPLNDLATHPHVALVDPAAQFNRPQHCAPIAGNPMDPKFGDPIGFFISNRNKRRFFDDFSANYKIKLNSLEN